MQKIAALIVLIVLSSCASPAPQTIDTPIPSLTLTPVVAVTQTPAATKAPEITATFLPTSTLEAPKLPDQLSADFASVNLEIKKYDVKVDGEHTVVTDKVTGKEIYRDGFELKWLVENLDRSTLMRYNVKPLNMPNRMDGTRVRELGSSLLKEPSVRGLFSPDHLWGGYLPLGLAEPGSTRYPWGYLISKDNGEKAEYLAYYTNDNTLHLIKLIPISGDEVTRQFSLDPDFYKSLK